jgi:2'-hydroxyisoflavone reductase
VFNATGPAQPLGLGGMLETIRAAVNPQAAFTWVPAPFLQAQGIAPWSDLPAWLGDGDGAGMLRADLRRAVDAGLTFRPLAETVRDTLAWFDALPAERRAAPRAGLSAQREQEVLAAWRLSRS